MSSFPDMLTEDEKNELKALKNAIDEHPWSVHQDKMERFTELFVKTLPRQEQKTFLTDKDSSPTILE